MADFPTSMLPRPSDGGVLSTVTTVHAGIAHARTALSTAWPSANLAIFVPIRMSFSVTVYKLVIGAGATAAGNFDVGIYDASGNKLVSSGATAKGSSVEHVIDITDTTLGQGMYYLALAADGTNNYIMMSLNQAAWARMAGVLQMASAYPLPTTATFAAAANAQVPTIAALLRGY